MQSQINAIQRSATSVVVFHVCNESMRNSLMFGFGPSTFFCF
jgi:hypothetical protein